MINSNLKSIDPVTTDLTLLSLNKCQTCDKSLLQEQIKKCSRCREVIYCSRECQTKDWKSHKPKCLTRESTSETTNETTTIITKSETDNKEISSRIKLNKHVKQAETVFSCFKTGLITLRESFTIYDFSNPTNKIPSKFKSQGDKFDHVKLTRATILKSSEHLNPKISTVLVLGAQYFNSEIIEPLPQLLEKCKKMILVDIDETTLKELQSLLNSPKVITKQVDLADSINEMAAFCKSLSDIKNEHDFFNNVVKLYSDLTIKTQKRNTPLVSVLEKDETADLVISSLVASQLPSVIQQIVNVVFEKIFKQTFSSVVRGHYSEIQMALNLSNLDETMVRKHADDLEAWAGPKGKIYLADTIDMKHVLHLDVFDQFKRNMKKNNKKYTTAEWNWIKKPDDIFKVFVAITQ